MKLQFKVGTVILVLGLLALSFWVGGCRHRKEADRLNVRLYDSEQTAKQSSETIAKQKVYISEATAQVVSSQSAIKTLKEEKDYLRNLHITDVRSISKLQLEISVLKKQGVYRDTLIRRDTITNIIDTTKTASWSDKYAYVNTVLYPKNPVFTFGLTNVDLKVYVGYKGILRNKPTISVTTENVYLKTYTANAVMVENDKKWLQKKYPYLIAGFIGGWLIFK